MFISGSCHCEIFTLSYHIHVKSLYECSSKYSNFPYTFLIFSFHGMICAGAGQGVWHCVIQLIVQVLVIVKHRLWWTADSRLWTRGKMQTVDSLTESCYHFHH